MAVIAKQTIVIAGTAVTYEAAASGGDTFVNNGKVMYRVTNAHATLTRTVTFVTSKVVDGDLNVADRTVVLAALSTVEFGPFDKGLYGTNVSVAYSNNGDDLTVALVEFQGVG
jgi:hypothetical protein